MEQIYMINQKIKSQKVINKFIIFINVDNDDRSIKQVDEQKTKLIEKKESLIDEQKTKLIEKEESLQNVSFSFRNMNISFDYSIKNNEQDQNGNELKNPYLKKDDVPELEIVGKNDIIMCDNDIIVPFIPDGIMTIFQKDYPNIQELWFSHNLHS